MVGWPCVLGLQTLIDCVDRSAKRAVFCNGLFAMHTLPPSLADCDTRLVVGNLMFDFFVHKLLVQCQMQIVLCTKSPVCYATCS